MIHLPEFISKVGKENCVFMVPMTITHSIMGLVSYTSSSDEHYLVPCVIDEERYPVSDNYKISLKPMVDGYSTEHFYQSDLKSLMDKGIVYMLKLLPEHAVKETKK